MKLTDILKELNKPENIYVDGFEEEDDDIFSKLTPTQRQELINTGAVMVPLPSDPNNPSTSGSRVIYLPKMDDIKREIKDYRREFNVFKFSSDKEIKDFSKRIISLYGSLYNEIDALNNKLKLKKSGRT